MTKYEKKQVLKAIHLIHETDDGYNEGMSILCHLVGQTTGWDKLGVHSIGLLELMRKMNEAENKSTDCKRA